VRRAEQWGRRGMSMLAIKHRHCAASQVLRPRLPGCRHRPGEVSASGNSSRGPVRVLIAMHVPPPGAETVAAPSRDSSRRERTRRRNPVEFAELLDNAQVGLLDTRVAQPHVAWLAGLDNSGWAQASNGVGKSRSCRASCASAQFCKPGSRRVSVRAGVCEKSHAEHVTPGMSTAIPRLMQNYRERSTVLFARLTQR